MLLKRGLKGNGNWYWKTAYYPTTSQRRAGRWGCCGGVYTCMLGYTDSSMLHWRTDILWYRDISQPSRALALRASFRQWSIDGICWIGCGHGVAVPKSEMNSGIFRSPGNKWQFKSIVIFCHHTNINIYAHTSHSGYSCSSSSPLCVPGTTTKQPLPRWTFSMAVQAHTIRLAGRNGK